MSDVVEDEKDTVLTASVAAILYRFVPSPLNLSGTLAIVASTRNAATLTSSSACTSASPRIGTNPARFAAVRRLSYFFKMDRIISRAKRTSLYVYNVVPPLFSLLLALRCTRYFLNL